ncbi:MAG: hypothetical protein DCC75_11390 [Proteobacteria bacterium]|nr:MAG: hypothetical protein DCC75_11390 [Pseudomonadota bacterium]
MLSSFSKGFRRAYVALAILGSVAFSHFGGCFGFGQGFYPDPGFGYPGFGFPGPIWPDDDCEIEFEDGYPEWDC